MGSFGFFVIKRLSLYIYTQIDAWQSVLPGDLLRSQMLFHRDRVVRAAFDGRVVSDNHALLTIPNPISIHSITTYSIYDSYAIHIYTAIYIQGVFYVCMCR